MGSGKEGKEKRPFKEDLTNCSAEIKKGKRHTEGKADRKDLGKDSGGQVQGQ